MDTQSQDIINTIMVWVFPTLLLIIVHFYKKDQKQKDIKITEMKKEFRGFMKSQVDMNQLNTKTLDRITYLLEAHGLDTFKIENQKDK